jgi:hypothetical protein
MLRHRRSARGPELGRALMRATLGLFVAMGTACHDPSARNEPAPAAILLALKLDAGDALAWGHRSELVADLDGDGSPETIVLACDVELSSEGAILWEDGHRWAVVVKDRSHATLAYSSFVPRGFVEVAILQEAVEHAARARDSGAGRPAAIRHRRELLVLERTPEQLRAVNVAYDGPGQVRAASAAYYQLESWLPGSATVPDTRSPD